MRGIPAVPSRTLGGAVVYRLNELSAFAVDQMGEPAAGVLLLGVGVEVGQALAPGRAVLGHVVVVPSVGLGDGEAVVDELQDRHLGLAVLGEKKIQQWCGDRHFCRGEEGELIRQRESSEHNTCGDVVPCRDAVEHVEAREAAAVLWRDPMLGRTAKWHQADLAGSPCGRRPSRRSTAASKPMPPTSEASSGAKAGGPDSRLYRVTPPGRCAMPRQCR